MIQPLNLIGAVSNLGDIQNPKKASSPQNAATVCPGSEALQPKPCGNKMQFKNFKNC